jgi:uncharacterized protein with ParB-like and HNH nuclease domain
MIQSANKYQISSIFDLETKIQYTIPKFQREYAWSKDQWQSLYDDIDDSDGGHFIGSIICINESRDSLGIMPLNVIDGQQRLTTISILYNAIYYKLIKLDIKDNDEFIQEKLNLKKRLMINHDSNIYMRLEPTYQNNNFQDYQYLLQENSILKNIPKPANLGNRRIFKAFLYFYNLIESFQFSELQSFLTKLNSALLIKIEVNNNADAFLLFESINNNGIPLSPIDLIKNNILANLERKEIKKIDEAFEDWKNLIENLNDYSIQERFLRHFYNAFKYKEKIKVTNISKATRSSLIKIYDKLIDKDVGYIFQELCDKAEIYNSLIDPIDNEKSIKFKSELIDLKNVGATPAYSFLLYLFTNYSDAILLKETISILVKYFTRRNLTDFPPTRNLDQIFIDVIDLCEKDKSKVNVAFLKEYFTDEKNCSKDSVFVEKLSGDIYIENPGMARFILCKIEDAHRTRENRRDLWEKTDKDKYLFTIEHIFPEGENVPKHWVDMIASGDKEKAKEFLVLYTHKIGNLTLTAYNSKLSNMAYTNKRDRKDNDGNLIGYKNGLYLNKKLVDKNEWNIHDINERTKELLKEAQQILNF